MSAKDVGLLRSLIREMVNEAPYQSSQRVVLQPVRAPGLNVGVLLQGVGIVVLIGTYKWLDEFTQCNERMTNFPIKTLPDAYTRATTQTAWEQAQDEYTLALRSTPSNSPDEPSDLMRATAFYAAINAAVAAWPKGVPWAGLTNKSDYVKKFVTVISMYSGCPEVFVTEKVGADGKDMPPDMQTREGAFAFYTSARDDAHESFTRTLNEYSSSHQTRFTDKAAVIKQFFTGKQQIEQAKYNGCKIQ